MTLKYFLCFPYIQHDAYKNVWYFDNEVILGGARYYFRDSMNDTITLLSGTIGNTFTKGMHKISSVCILILLDAEMYKEEAD